MAISSLRMWGPDPLLLLVRPDSWAILLPSSVAMFT